MAEITVDVGVKLNVLQSSLADLQKVLKELQPDSSGYKNLSKIISEMTREMEKFQIQTSKGFTSPKQFDQASRSIEKMEDTLTKAQIAMSNLKFSDIKLNPNQTKAFDSLEQAISLAEQRLEGIKEKTKQGIFSDSTAINTLAQLDKNGITKSFDEIDAIVTRGTKQIEGKIVNAEAQIKELRATVGSQKSINTRAENLLTKGITADDWGNLLNKAGTGFKAGGKQEFLQILKDQFKVSDADIEEIKKLSFDKINSAFKNQKFENIFDNFKKAFGENSSSLNDLEKNLDKLKNLQGLVQDLYNKMNEAKGAGTPLGQGISEYNSEIDKISKALAELRNQTVQNISSNANFNSSLTAMRGQLQSFTAQLEQANVAFLRLQQQQQTFNSLKTAIVNFMGFNQVLNLTKKAISEALNHIKELDSVMNGISIVTNMTTADLWKQVDAYSEMAQNFGVTIKGAYEVSRIYYQQGLETNDVLNLTNETLKLSKVSGLDYAQSTDYMTTAIRGFKMEMSEASTVVDVYSNLAANTAVSQEELAVAMSKTASSMESVGSTFQDTSAMIATMVAVTRESATNIGSAMKSIASRYGELTKDPTKLMDSEGEAMSFNKVDTALKSVGITLQTVDHQFRSFTDVITELADKWDTLDSAQQRYIATQFAGNRQQSRFLALVSNKELLEENRDVAANSEDVGDLQALKALDSIESKLNQVQVAYQQFYTTIGAEGLWKGLLDGVRNFIDSLNDLPKAFGKIPVNAFVVILDAINLVKDGALWMLSVVAEQWQKIFQNNSSVVSQASKAGQEAGEGFKDKFESAIQPLQNILNELMEKIKSDPTQNLKEVEKLTEQARNSTSEVHREINVDKTVDSEKVKKAYTDISALEEKIKEIKEKGIDVDTQKFEIKLEKLKSAMETLKKDSKIEPQSQEIFNEADLSSKIENVKAKLSELSSVDASPEQLKQGLEEAESLIAQIKQELEVVGTTNPEMAEKLKQDLNEVQGQAEQLRQKLEEAGKTSSGFSKIKSHLGGLGSVINIIAMAIDKSSVAGRIFSGVLMGIAGVFKIIDGLTKSNPWMALATGALLIINGLSTAIETSAEKLERLNKEAEKLSNEAKQAKADYNTLQRTSDKLEELKEKRYESAEAAEEYQNAVEDLASKFPQLIAGFDEAGNIILDTTNAEAMLSEAREKSAQASYDAAQAELAAAKQKLLLAKEDVNEPTFLETVSLPDSSNSKTQERKDFLTSGVFKQFSLNDEIKTLDSVDYVSFFSYLATYLEALTEEERQSFAFFDEILAQTGEEKGSIEDFKNNLLQYLNNQENLTETEEAFFNALIEDGSPSNSNIEELNNLITQIKNVEGGITSDKGIQLYKQLGAKYQEITNSSYVTPEMLESLSGVEAFLASNNEAMSDFISLSNIYQGYEKAVVSAWQNASQNIGETWEYLAESSNLAAVITKQIVSDFAGQDLSQENQEQQERLTQYQQAVEEFYSRLSPDNQELLNAMLSDADNFSAQDIVDKFNISESSEMYKLLTNYYQEGADAIKERLQSNLSEKYQISGSDLDTEDTSFLNQYGQLIYDAEKAFTRNEEVYLQSILSEYQKLNEKGFGARAEAFGQSSLKLFSEIQELPAETQKVLLATIRQNGLSTKEGIEAIINSAKANPNLKDTGIIDNLQAFEQNLIENLSLSLQSAASDLTANWDDASKDIKKLTSGMSLKEVDNFIQKAEAAGIEVNYSDFKTSGDKLVLSSEAYTQYWEDYSAKMQENAESWTTKVKDASSIIESLDTNAELDRWVTGSNGQKFLYERNQQTFEAIEALTGDAEGFYANLENVDVNGRLTEIGKQALAAAAEAAGKQAEYYTWLTEQAEEEMTKSLEWAKGNYSSLMKNGKFTQKDSVWTSNGDEVEQIETEIFNVEEFNEYLRGEKSKYNAEDNSDLKSAVENARNGVSSFISALLTKGVKKFNASDFAESGIEVTTYKDMVKDLATIGQEGGMTYTDFVKKYYDLTGATVAEINAEVIKAMQMDDATGATAQKQALSDLNIVGNILSGTKEQINALATSIGNVDVETLIGKDLGNGQFELNITNEVENLLTQFDIIKQSIPTQLKNYSDILTKGANLISKGTNDFAEMQSFADQYAKSLGQQAGSISWDQIFNYDSTLQSYILSAEAYNTYSRAQAEILKNAGDVDEEIANILNQATNILANNVKISDFLKSSQKSGQADTDLYKQLKNYYESVARQEIQNLPDYAVQAALESAGYKARSIITALSQGGNEAVEVYRKFIQDTQNRDLTADEVKEAYLSELNEYKDAFSTIKDGLELGSIVTGDKLTQALKDADFEIDENGVITAVGSMVEAYHNLYEGMKKSGEATTSELNAAYLDIINENTKKDSVAGTMLSSATNLDSSALENFASTMGYHLEAMLDESGNVINGWANSIQRTGTNSYEVVDWNRYVQQVETAIGHQIDETSKEYIDSYVAWLENQEVKTPEGKAALMTSMTASMNKLTREQIGQIAYAFGKTYNEVEAMLTKNADGTFDGRALLDSADFDFDKSSYEYTSALKTLNDSLIEENRRAEKAILEEAQSVASAKGGDWINLTQLTDALQDSFKIDSLSNSLQQFGGQIEDGILKLDDSANIPAIMQEIAKAAAESGGLLSSELAELADTVADVIKGYADLISGAISGSLSNVQAEQLQDWASTNGIGKLNFTETADGLKVATDQAFELVAALRQVDSMQGKLVFDNLVDSLSADKGGRFENISKTTAEIANKRREIAKVSEDIAAIEKRSAENQGQMSSADKEKLASLRDQKKELNDQLNLYQQIQQRQSIDPAQYNFMDRDLPDTMQGPINYWNSVGQAFSAMNESSKTGRMEIQDFYNIVNEMENLANTSGQVFDLAGYKIGGSASEAAKLIQDGMGKLDNIDGKGVKVNLQNLGVDFASGADGAKKNFADGVHALAESQVAMLDAAIQVLEVVVAMEKLGDIDVDSNNVFSIGDIFKLDDKGNPIPEYTEEFQQYAADLLEAAKTNEDLRKGLENFSINGVSLKEMFEDATDGIKKLNISEEAYFAVMEAFVNAAKNGDYNLDTIQDSVWEILDKTLPDGSVIDMGDRSIVISGGTHTVIDWKAESTQEALKKFKGTEEEKKKALIQAFQNYSTGKSDSIDVEAVLTAKGIIKTDTENGGVIIDGKHYNTVDSVEAKQAIAKAALKDSGIENISNVDANKNGDKWEVTASGTITVGNKVLNVSYTNGEIKYHSELLNKDFGSTNELMHAEYQDFINKQMQTGQQHGANIQLPTYEQWVYQQYGITVNTQTTFKNKDGKEADPANDPELKASIDRFVNKSHAEIQKYLSNPSNWDNQNGNGDGTFTFNLPDGGSITVEAADWTEAQGKVTEEAKRASSPLIQAVSSGIKDAFTSEDNSVGKAIGEGITSALSNYTITIDSAGNIVFKPKGDGAEIDKPSAETAAETAAEKVTDLNIPSVDAKITKLNITDVQDAGMGGSGLVNQLGKDLFGSKSFTIPSADAAVTKLTITSVTNSEYKAGDDAASPTIESLDAAITSLKISADEVDVESVKQQIIDALKEAVEIPATVSTEDAIAAINSINDAIEEGKTKPINADSDKGGADGVISDVDTSIETSKTKPINADSDKGGADEVIKNVDANIEASKTKPVNADSNKGGADGVIKAVDDSIETSKTKPVNADSDKGGANAVVDNLEKDIEATTTKPVDVNVTLPEIWDKLDDTVSKTVKVSAQKTGTWPNGVWPASSATGNVALSKGNLQGRAYSAGNTLMGELGPEIVVSHGRYFVVGQNGPEMVNLAEDAIVFNHLQTEQLLRHGKASGHAQPVTNERKATSLATGNVGPAMASASAALAALKQLRSMWQSLLNASLKDMGSMGGSGGGGGGGGGGGDAAKYVEGITANVERWYNWLKAIEKTQTNINLLTKKYTLLEKQGASTAKRAENLTDQYKNLQKELGIRQQLTAEQKKYRKELLNQVKKGKGKYGALSAFYQVDGDQLLMAQDDAFSKYVNKHGSKQAANATKSKRNRSIEISTNVYDEKGNVDEKAGKKVTSFKMPTSGLKLVEKLQKTKSDGSLKYSAEEQFQILKELGFAKFMKTDASGKKLFNDADSATLEQMSAAVENFFSKIESGEQEISSLTDSINEQTEAAVDDKIAIAEINEQLVDLAKPAQGVTEHLESWYEWSRKIIDSQHELNMLTAKYSQLQNSLGNNNKAMLKNLQKQAKETKNQLNFTKEETAGKKKEYEDQFKNAGAQFDKEGNLLDGGSLYGGLMTVKNGNVVFSSKKLKTSKKGFKITSKNIKKDQNGNAIKTDGKGNILNKAELTKQLRENKLTEEDKVALKLSNTRAGNGGMPADIAQYYDVDIKNKRWVLNKQGRKAKKIAREKKANLNAAKSGLKSYKTGENYYKESTVFTKDIDTSSPQKFFESLTAKDKYGASKFTPEQQREVLEQAGLTNEMKDFAKTLEIDWDLADAEKRNDIAQQYLEHIQKVPEELNKAKDAYQENLEKEEEQKNKILEINNQIRELVKPIQGVTNHLEAWYTWSRKIVEAQNELNLLTAQYNNLEKKGASSQELNDNISKQYQQKLNEKNATQNQRDTMATEYQKELDNFNNSALTKIFSNEQGFMDYGTNKLSRKKGKFKISMEEIERDKNGHEVRYDENGNALEYNSKAYKESGIVGTKTVTKEIQDVFKKNMTAKDLVTELTRETPSGKAVYSGTSQAEVLHAYGLDDLMKEAYADFTNWDEMDDTERANAAAAVLELIEQYPDKMNEFKDKIAEADVKLEDIEGSLIDDNNKLKEMATPAAGVTEHLERWYNYIQDAVSAQNKLNLLTAEYNTLSLQSVTTNADLLKKLQEQQTQNKNNQDAIKNELNLREDQLNEDEKKLKSSAVVKKGIYKFDKTTGRLEYDLNGDKFRRNLSKAGVKVNKKGQAKFKVTNKEILTDKNGNQLTEEEVARRNYRQAKTDFKNGKISEKKLNKLKTAYEQNKGNTKLAYRESSESVSIDVSDPEKFIKDLTSTDGNNNFIHSAEQVGEILKQAGFEDLLKEVNGEFFDTSTQEGLTAAAKAWMASVKDIPGTYNDSLDAVEQLRVKQEEAKKQVIETNQQMIELTRRTSAVIDNHEAWYNIARKIERVQLKINKLTIQYENLTKKLGDNTSQQIANLNKQAETTRTSINYQEKQLKKQKEVRDANAKAAVKRYGDFYNFDESTGELRENTAKAGLGKIKYETGSLKMNADGTYAVNEDGSYIYDEKASSNSIDFTGKSWAWIKKELTSKDEYNPERSKYTADELRQITLQIPGYEEKIAQYAGLQTLDGLAPEKLNEIIQEYWESMVNAKDATAEESDAIKEGENNLEKEKGTLLDINNSIRELLKPTAGVTEHLDSWYNLTRKTVIAQQKLNKLTAKFSNLEKKPGDNAQAMAKNLSKQGEQYQNNLDINKEIITARKEDLAEERKKVKNNKALSKLLSFDENKNLVYSENKISGLNGKTISVNEIARDKNGHEIRIREDGTVVRYGQKGYEDEKNYVKTATKKYNLTGKGGIFENALDENGNISAQKFVEILTETDAAGNAKLSLEQQQAILEQIGITGKDLTQFGDFENWDEATAEQRKEAIANYLKAIPEAAERINGLKDEVINLEVENINLEGNILDVNNQLKELATIAAGIQNPFEQWHSWLQKIKQEQNQLNILTQRYGNLDKERVNNGAKIAANLRKQLKNLKQQQETNQKYLEARQTDYNDLINRSNWTKAQKKFFQVDKNGQLQYNNKEFEKQIKNNKGIELIGGTDENGVYNYRNIEETIDFSATGIEDFLDKLTKQNADNSMAYNADQQFAILKAFGFSDLMQFDSAGNPIFKNGIENATKEEREAAVKTVLDNLKGFQEKVESSADDLQELKEKGIELTGNVIDIKNQIQDNEIELENKILQAIEDREQKRIDDLKEQKDMLSEAADNFLNGLNEQLSKERDMYEKQESQDELTKLQRQLAILQRSGGSSSQIRSLQEQIKSQQKDMYFDERQDQIDAIKEASDKQIEKLDRQIQIAEETLAFNRENGLYWKEVREIMKLDSAKILSFIETNLAERKGQSTLQADLAITDDGKIVGTYTGTRGMAFKTGGLADYTGPAWLDGTKKKPESVLSAEQTSFLRNKLIDNLESFSFAISQFTNGTLSNNILGGLGENAGINIEQLDFVMKVDSLANDYDAKRAGQQAFEEMVRIARKAGNRSISRR